MLKNKTEEKELKQLMRNIGRILNENNYSISYICKLGFQVEKLLKTSLGVDVCVLPVDVELVAKRLGLQVKEKYMNPYFDNLNKPREFFKKIQDISRLPLSRRNDQLIIWKNTYTGLIEKTIYTDILDPLSRRYAIAHGIAQFLFIEGRRLLNEGKNISDSFESCFVMDMCPKSLEEIKVELLSIFLLIPVEQFFTVYEKYISCCGKLDISASPADWISYLAKMVDLSDYYTTCGYQNLRKVAYWIYQAHTADEEMLKEIGMSKAEKRMIKENTKYFNQKMSALCFFA